MAGASSQAYTPQVIQECQSDQKCQDECHLTCGSQLSVRCAMDTQPRCVLPPAAPSSTAAGATGGSSGSSARLSNPIGVSSIQALIGRLIRGLIGIAGSLALAAFVWGGLMYMTARGESGQIKRAREILTNALLGLVLIFFSYSLVSVFLEIFTTTARVGS